MLFLGLLLVHFIATQIFTGLANNLPYDNGTVAQTVLRQAQVTVNNLEMAAIAGFFGLLLTFLVTAWFTQGNPVLIIGYFAAGVVSILVSMLMSNFWEDITANALLQSSLSYFAFSNHIMLNLPLYVGVFWFVGLVITFAKPGSSGGEKFG